ncbi:uncharacterized protein M421DRAFT_72617 [Didymella exigua CBS 183.55]|uniref:RBR-type E3 ubiquitin transferase n=1 Tax=Didymella exigua CBS 183.55 TaxID=1150837 RepID=A0A6A5R9D1_9PLEO|nr:uncharacterized protein M421DRAFT_72617 [Didymella exigua CBS 183.55]KAF1924352.1 hypothetical protein M421DRAFT_72617 [Didymella exigua CBS 183.55]
MYCSIECAHKHFHEEPLKTTKPVIPCDVCASDKELTSFIHISYPEAYDERGETRTNLPIPSDCVFSIMPERRNFESGVCVDCIATFLETQFRARGARGITCVSDICYWHDPDGINSWLDYALAFLPEVLHANFQQQMLELWLSRMTRWVCPGSCQSADYIVEPANTAGYPQVYCESCEQRFCAICRVPWHAGVTCQQYHADHPELRDEDEVQVLTDMAKAGARRCPCCQSVIIKDGGCSYMVCEACGFEFHWGKAEKIGPTVGGEDDFSAALQGGGDPAESEEDDDGYYEPPAVCEMDRIV